MLLLLLLLMRSLMFASVHLLSIGFASHVKSISMYSHWRAWWIFELMEFWEDDSDTNHSNQFWFNGHFQVICGQHWFKFCTLTIWPFKINAKYSNYQPPPEFHWVISCPIDCNFQLADAPDSKPLDFQLENSLITHYESYILPYKYVHGFGDENWTTLYNVSSLFTDACIICHSFPPIKLSKLDWRRPLSGLFDVVSSFRHFIICSIVQIQSPHVITHTHHFGLIRCRAHQ